MDADKKKIIFIFGGLVLFLAATSIYMRSTTNSIREEHSVKSIDKNSTHIDAPQEKDNKTTGIASIMMRIDDRAFEISIDSGKAGQEFAKATPFELEMDDLNGNEKYYEGDDKLPKNEYAPGHIEAGDVMLYGDDCVVIFYKSFDTTEKYTRLGKIQDATGLAEAVGSGRVSISFTKN